MWEDCQMASQLIREKLAEKYTGSFSLLIGKMDSRLWREPSHAPQQNGGGGGNYSNGNDNNIWYLLSDFCVGDTLL